MLIVLVPSSAYLIKNILNLEQRWSTRKKLQNYSTTSKLLQRDLTHLDDASNPHVTRAYYERLFPFKQMYQFYNVPTRLFTNREFAFTVKDDIYLRYLSFSTWDEWKKETLRLNPTRFEIGAVYTARPRDKKSLGPSAFKTKERELVFDIDMTDYDEIRTCAAGKDICEQCWGFVVAAMRILDTVLRQDFGYKHLLWVFSGRRGIHCWVSDPAARALTDEQRKALVGYIEVVRGSAQQAKKVHISQNLPRGAPWHPSLMRGYEQLYECFEKTVLEDQDAFRDDPAWRTLLSLLPDQDVAKSLSNEWVNKPGLNSREKFKQIRKVCVPVDVSKAEEFNPSKVPTIGQLLRELEQLPATAGRDVSQVAEVGWQFVTQYYNYVNAKPENLHYFYNKDSTFIHGFEDGDERTCFGQSEINSRVSEIGFENCKVFVHSLDSQSSADGGILVQVVGEMSNRNGPWRKFAQTFFLAQQQSGYFVLNDIFRYLRDDDEVDEEKQHTPVADVESDLKETTEDEATNGIAAPKVASPVPAAIASPTPPADVQTGEAEKVSSPVPATATTSAVQSPKPAVASPEKSNQPKTWANLAASNSKKWGQVAQDKVSPSIQSAATATSPRTNKADASKPLSQAQQNVQSVSHALCFVKNVTDQIQSNQIPGWSQQYLDYKALKKIINSMIKGRPKDAGSLSIGIRPRKTSGNDNGVEEVSIEEYRSAFFFKLERELEKINAFYLAKESELKIRIQILIDKKRVLATTNNKQSNEVALDEGFQYFERQLVALQAYVDINATGFRKILKKWDKRSKSNTKELYLARQVEVQPVFNREALAELSNVVATNLIDLENLKNQNQQDQLGDPMSIDGDLETNSDIENIIIKLLKKDNTEGLIGLLQNHKGLRLTWESLAYATSQEQIDSLISLASIEWSYIDDINNRTCLHKAAIVGNLPLLLLALENKVEPTRTDIYGRNSVHYAALNGHDKILEHLLKLDVIDGATPDLDGYTPSLYTIVNGHDDCLKLLVSQLSSPAASNLHPLCLAAQYGHESIVKTLLSLSKDDIGPNAEGLYPQHLAARGGHANICKLLATKGGEKQGGLHIKDKYSAWTPLIHAADSGHIESVDVLLEFGCDPTALDENDNSAVFYAAWNGHMDCVDALMKVKRSEVPIEKIMKSPKSDKNSGDLDEIPSLALPPPMMPLRIYGHNYLLKRSLLNVILTPTPIRLSENDEEFKWSSLKLIVMQKPDMLNAPYHLIIPSQKQEIERSLSEFSFQIETEHNVSLDFSLYPGFGSVIMGKAVALPQALMISRENKHTLPIIDNHLKTIGRITFETSLIKPYVGLQEHSANVNAYWKSTTSVSANNQSHPTLNKRDSPTLTPTGHGEDSGNSATIITSSSLPSEFTRLYVQSSKDSKAVVSSSRDSKNGLPFNGLEGIRGLQVNDFMFEDLCKLSKQNQVDAESLGKNAKLASMESIFEQLPKFSHVLLDVKRGDVGDINSYIDDILKFTYATASSSTRNMAFVTSDTDVAVCLQWKQPHFPVFVKLTSQGSVKESVDFIKSNNLLGLFVDHDLLMRITMILKLNYELEHKLIAKKSEFKPPVDILDVDENAFVYDIMRLYNLSGSLPFKNHVHLHSFNKEVQDKGVLDGLRDVLLAYAIPSIQSEVSSNVRITASALRALDEGDYNLAIGLLNSPAFLHTLVTLDNYKIMDLLYNNPTNETQLKRSSRVISFVRSSRNTSDILSNERCERIYVSALASKSIPAAMNYINGRQSGLNRSILIEEILKVSLLPNPVAKLLEELSKLSLTDGDVEVIRAFANGTSSLTSTSVSPSSIAAAHDLLLVRYIQAGQIPDAIKLNKGALSVVLSHGIGSVKRGQLISEAWSVLPGVQKTLVEREVGKDEKQEESDEEMVQDPPQPETTQVGSWIDVRLEQENKVPATPFAPLRKAAPPVLPQSPLSGPPKFSTPTAPTSTPVRNVQTKHKVAESPFAQLLGKSIAREKEKNEQLNKSINKSAFEIPSVTDIASRSLSTPAKRTQKNVHTPVVQTPEAGNESKDKITDLPDLQALQSVRRTRSVMPSVKKEDKRDDDDDIEVPGSYPYTPQPTKQQQSQRNLRSTTLRSSNRRTSLKRNSDDVQMDESDDDEIALPGSYIPTPQPARGRKSSAGGPPKSAVKRTTRRTSNAGSNPPAPAPPTTRRQTRSSSRLNN
ncbi:hypothetical protein E3Q00_03942 [Wallemia mellicola]|nr:hypothetical protein E3Q00_03942 [Wallemia mellicola]